MESLIYEIRGHKVMLDVDLAKIYGYETKNFNRQVKNNIEKFPSDFMFQLTEEEILRCKNFTSSWGVYATKAIHQPLIMRKSPGETPEA